ncbi:hypothetical protein HN51_021813 [Arachis hypogaea]
MPTIEEYAKFLNKENMPKDKIYCYEDGWTKFGCRFSFSIYPKPWVPLVGPWGVTSYAPTLVQRDVGSLQFFLMTLGLMDIDFTYIWSSNTVSKVKEIISNWKDVRCIKSGVRTIDTTPRYLLWQYDRGKGFKAPMVTDPKDYKAEVDYRYEDAFKILIIGNNSYIKRIYVVS